MLTNNPFNEIASTISPTIMMAFVFIMILLVVAGTIFDVIHKKSAKYFFDSMKKAKSQSVRSVGGGEKFQIACATAAHDVLASGEFCNPRRRIAHLLTMYGFILFLVTSCVMICIYSEPGTSHTCCFSATMAPWCCNGLRRGFLVLVLHFAQMSLQRANHLFD